MSVPRAAVLLISLLTVGATAGAQVEIVQAPNDGELYLAVGPRATAVGRVAGGVAAALDLPPDAIPYDLGATREGWVLTAAIPRGSTSSLFVLEAGAEGIARLAEPRRDDAVRASPVPLVDDGRLVGLAWLEGRSGERLAVRAATWDGAGWGLGEQVSSPGPDSQLALTGTVLHDGRWLLLWSAGDGGDDEILWSVRATDGTWTPPRRLHPDNRVPDVQPAVVAVDGGALAAWSWFDGNDYRLRTARFDGRAWRQGEVLGGRGALAPALFASGSRLLLLARSVQPAAWTVFDLDGVGRARGQASLSAVERARPVVRVDEAGVRMSWALSDGALPVAARFAPWRTAR